jgi:hypothetical protein
VSEQDQPHEGGGGDRRSEGSRLDELASQDRPVMTDVEDDLGTRGDPDAVDSVTGRRREGSGEQGGGIADVAAVTSGGGLSGATGIPGIGVPEAEEAREEGAERASES